MDSTDAHPVLNEQNSNLLIRSYNNVSGTVADQSVSVQRDSLDYPMRAPSGKASRKAYIFNHQYFDVSLNLTERTGTKMDEKSLEMVLPQLGFQVKCFYDYPVDEIRKTIKELAEDDYTEDDCLMIIVLTHGDDNGILFARDKSYYEYELWNPFVPSNCVSLTGKPKLFITQACRGSKVDSGVKVEYVADALLDNCGPINYVLPIWADFMHAYCTVPGAASWRNTNFGSYFIQAICKVLSEYGQTEDLLSMMTLVVQEVATRETAKEFVQTPCIVTQLIRRVYFHPTTLPNA